MPHLNRLMVSAFRAADQVLPLALNPEMRWIVGHVGQDGDERHAGHRAGHGVENCPVEIRNYRNHHRRRAVFPITGEKIDLRRMIGADYSMHQRKQLGGPQRPATPQDQVIDILQADSREFTEDVDFVEKLLEIHETHVPAALLTVNDVTERIGGAAVAAAGVEEHQFERLHRLAKFKAMASREHAQVMAAESRLDGWVPPLFRAAPGGRCASEELAQVMAAESRLDGRVPPLFRAATGGPCVSIWRRHKEARPIPRRGPRRKAQA